MKDQHKRMGGKPKSIGYAALKRETSAPSVNVWAEESLPDDRDMTWVSGLMWGQEEGSNAARDWLEEETHVSVRIQRALKEGAE